MKKKPVSKSVFFGPRFLIGLASCSIAFFLALLACALYPGGEALARQNQFEAQGLAQNAALEQAEKQSLAEQSNYKGDTIPEVDPDASVTTLPATGYAGLLPSVPLRSEEILASQGFGGDVEPNNTFGTATPLVGSNVVVRANIVPNGDIDFYSFTASGGDRIYAAVMTAFTASGTGNSDSQLTLLASDGTTVLEFDEDDHRYCPRRE